MKQLISFYIVSEICTKYSTCIELAGDDVESGYWGRWMNTKNAEEIAAYSKTAKKSIIRF
jgi:hypothetical protein